MTLEKDRGDWDVTDDGDFLDGSCGEGSTSSTTEDLLIASSWRWVDSVYPASDETGSGTDDTWQFAPTNLGNGSLLINGGGTGDRWFLSETIWTEWTLSETYDVFLVIDGEGTEPYTYGIKAISETELELHHDVGVESDRIDRFAAE
ncbi:MAG: hypothetical protein GY884_02660 [Proteobacteria bacterium]|nr:hypothetical protein [Pseudomonadota bacterium]